MPLVFINPYKMTSLQKNAECVYPGFPELSMEKIHHHVLLFNNGTRNLWRQGQCWIQGEVGDQEHLRKTFKHVRQPFTILL